MGMENMNHTSFDFYRTGEKVSRLIGAKLYVLVCCLVVAVSAWSQTPIQVEAMYPELVEQSHTLQLSGSVQAKQNAQLATLESGRVESLAFEVGDVVEQGQVLLTLEHHLAELQLAGAAAELEAADLNRQEAKRLYDEVQRLSAQKVVAKTLIAERAALLARAEAELARVKANHSVQKERLNRHRLKAPFAGVIAERHVDVGEWVTPQNPVLTLVAQSDLRLTVEVPQQHYHTLINATDVQVKLIPDAVGNEPVLTRLSRLVPVSNFQTRTFTAQMDLPEGVSGHWIQGMSATAEMTIPGSSNASIVLPQSAIKRHPDGNSSVFVVENNRAKRVVTSFTPMAGGLVSIQGLSAKQAYITKGVEVLKDGSLVEAQIIQDKRP